jgi:hypothetical protein
MKGRRGVLCFLIEWYYLYTPVQYPFTMVYKSELQIPTTAFIPQWYPVSNYYVSVEKHLLMSTYPATLGF